MSNSCQPQWSTVVRIWFVMNREYTTDSVLIQIQSERQIDLLRYARGAAAGITLFHFYDGFDDFFGWSFRTWLPATTR